MRKRLATTLCFFLSASSIAHAAPKAVLWERWLANNPDSTLTVAHTPWNSFLEKYLVKGDDGVNRIAYGKVTKEDRAVLEEYIGRLETRPVSGLGRVEQRAYWINLYNALTVKVILEHYPVESIRDIDISPGLFSDGPWGRKLTTVEGVEVTLDDIEHRILRPIWMDPRIHYAVNCAALSCPNLQGRAFTSENTEELLDRGAADYINHPRGVWFEDGRLHVSSIYKWFISDFEGDHQGVIKHLRKYARPGLLKGLEGERGFEGHAYDWSLNEAQ